MDDTLFVRKKEWILCCFRSCLVSLSEDGRLRFFLFGTRDDDVDVDDAGRGACSCWGAPLAATATVGATATPAIVFLCLLNFFRNRDDDDDDDRDD